MSDQTRAAPMEQPVPAAYQTVDGPRRFGLLDSVQASGLPAWAALLTSLALSFLLVSLHVFAYTKISPSDELQHIDYVYRMPTVVRSGQFVGEQALREEACRGIDAKFQPPPCDSRYLHPTKFQELGFNTAYIHPPVYYAMTASVARAAKQSFGGDLVTWARLAGALWLGLGMFVIWLIARWLGASETATWGSLLLLASTPGVLFPSSTVTPDSLSVLVGGLVCLGVLTWERSRWRLLALPLIGVLAVSVKLNDAIVVMALAVYLVAAPLLRAEASSWWRRLAEGIGNAALLGVGTATAAGIWSTVVNRIAIMSPNLIPMNVRYHASRLTFAMLRRTLPAFIPPVRGSYQAPFMRGTGHLSTYIGLTYSAVLVAAVLIGIVAWRAARLRALAIGTAVAMVLGGPVYTVLGYFSQHIFIGMPARYGLTLCPLLAVVLARAVRGRVAANVLLAFGMFAAGFVVVKAALAI